MAVRILRNPFFWAGFVIAVPGALLLLWHGVFVMNEAEIARLEAGGNGNYTAFETFAWIGGSAMLVVGSLVMAFSPLWKGGARARGEAEAAQQSQKPEALAQVSAESV